MSVAGFGGNKEPDPAKSCRVCLDESRVAERRAKERPRRMTRAWWTGIRRELRKARCGPRARRMQGGKTARTCTNVEAGWSEGWLPRMAQHDRQTLKGNQTSREADRIGLMRRFAHESLGRKRRTGKTNLARPWRTREPAAAELKGC